MARKKTRKRTFKVPRGTATDVANELGLARSHVTRVINGDREGGERLVEALEIVEMDHADRCSERTARELR